jgi:hypothetical protein
MGRDGEQLATASKPFDLLTGELETDPAQVRETGDLRAIADAAAAVAVAEDHLKATVEAARSEGRSWRQIGLMLGVSRQVARERYGQPTAKRKASRARRVMRHETAVLDRLALNQSKNGTLKHHPDDANPEKGQAKKARRPH